MATHTRSRRRSRGNSSVRQIKRLLNGSGGVCILYIIVYAVIYGRGDPSGFLRSDLNFVMYFIIGLAYVIYVAGAIKSYMLSDKYKMSFKWYWVLGVVLTLFFILVVVMNYLTAGEGRPLEFTPYGDTQSD